LERACYGRHKARRAQDQTTGRSWCDSRANAERFAEGALFTRCSRMAHNCLICRISGLYKFYKYMIISNLFILEFLGLKVPCVPLGGQKGNKGHTHVGSLATLIVPRVRASREAMANYDLQITDGFWAAPGHELAAADSAFLSVGLLTWEEPTVRKSLTVATSSFR